MSCPRRGTRRPIAFSYNNLPKRYVRYDLNYCDIITYVLMRKSDSSIFLRETSNTSMHSRYVRENPVEDTQSFLQNDLCRRHICNQLERLPADGPPVHRDSLGAGRLGKQLRHSAMFTRNILHQREARKQRISLSETLLRIFDTPIWTRMRKDGETPTCRNAGIA